MIQRMCSRGLAIVVLLAAIGIGTADAAQREPAREVSASFRAHFSAPVLAVPCNGSLTRNKFVINAMGHESDLSDPSEPRLGGKLQLKIVYVENGHGAVLGHITTVLKDQSSGQTLYSGRGTFVGRADFFGNIQASGLLQAALYANGKPTARQLVASTTFVIGDDGIVKGGFGEVAPAEAITAIETTGSTC